MKEKIAKRLLVLAKEIIGYGGKNVAVRELPDSIQNALKRLGFGSRDIEVISSSTYFVAPSFEGNRAISMAVNISSGQIKDYTQGSWGGSNPFEDRQIDRGEKMPVPNGSVVIAGESGGRGKYFSIYVNPSDLDRVMPVGVEEEVHLSNEEQKALDIIGGIKGGYRQKEFQREGLGNYSNNNPIIQKLEKEGLVQVMSNGIRMTTKGQNQRKRY